MKKVVFALVAWLCMACPVAVFGEGSYEDHSSSIAIDLGSGNGAVIIVGDGNTVYLPPTQEPAKCEPNAAAVLPDGSAVLLLQETSLKDTRGFVLKFKRIAIKIDNAGLTTVLWAEAE